MTVDKMVAEFARLGVATVYESAGRVGLIDEDWKQLIPGSRAAGPARTARLAHGDNRAVHEVVAHLEPGEVVVLAMEDPAPYGVVGELLATQMRAAGAAAVLVDAGVRDSERLLAMRLPIWTRWVRPRGATKVAPGAVNVPVTVGGSLVKPGDIVVLDSDGAVVVDHKIAAATLEASRVREGQEAAARGRYLAGELSYDHHGFRAEDSGG